MQQEQLPAQCEVLVVGGGPVGTALTIELAQRGIDVVLVERREKVFDLHPMARNLNLRSMEHARRWGVAAQLHAAAPLPAAHRQDLVFCTGLFGHDLGVFPFYGRRPELAGEVASECSETLPLACTLNVLRPHASKLGARVLTGWTCHDLKQDDDGVNVELTSTEPGQAHRIRARYVVGCDGARSVVRQAAGIVRTGQDATRQNFVAIVRIPGLLEKVKVTPSSFYLIFNNQQQAAAGPLDAERWDIDLLDWPLDAQPTDEDFLSVGRQIYGEDAPITIEYVSSYRVQVRIAERYRQGRLFIAGDAAHLFPAIGGNNMNTGVGDAVDLGWKLAAVLRGWGGEALLDAYEAERRPIALRTAANASEGDEALDGLGERLATLDIPEDDSPASQARREEIGCLLYDQTYAEWNTEGIVLDQRYDQSNVVIDDGSSAPQWDETRYQPFAKPGHRAPHVQLADGTPLYDHLGSGFTLLDLGGDVQDIQAWRQAAAATDTPLTVLELNDANVRQRYGARLVLVRPDQHVAWRGDRAPQSPRDALLQVTGRHVEGAQ